MKGKMFLILLLAFILMNGRLAFAAGQNGMNMNHMDGKHDMNSMGMKGKDKNMDMNSMDMKGKDKNMDMNGMDMNGKDKNMDMGGSEKNDSMNGKDKNMDMSDSKKNDSMNGMDMGGNEPVKETPANLKVLGTYGAVNLSFILIGVWNKWFRRKDGSNGNSKK